MLSVLKEAKMTLVKAEVAAGTTAVSDAAIVDMQGFSNVAFVAVLGSDNADTAVVGLSAVLGDASDLSDGSEDAANKASYTFTSATSGDNKLLVLDVIRPSNRYVRCKINRATANSNVLALIAIQYNGDNIPTLPGDVIASALKVC